MKLLCVVGSPQNHVLLLLASVVLLILGSPTRAGECIESDEYYVTQLEDIARKGPPFSYHEAYICLIMRCRPEDWRRWAGPMAAELFQSCRTHPLRARIGTACQAFLADTTGRHCRSAELDAGSAIAASFGYSKLADYDIFARVTDAIVRAPDSPDPKFGLLAIMRDPRTPSFLTAVYDSLAVPSGQQRVDRVGDILNCLYHCPGDSSIALAQKIFDAESSTATKERARRVVNRE